MPRIKPAAQQENTEAIFREIESVFGMRPNLFTTFAHFPPLLEANWNKVKAVMMQGNLSRKLKETIVLLVSQDNSCKYCVAAHTGALKMIGVSDEEIERIETDLEKAEFSEKEKLLIELARSANRNALRVTDADFIALKELGATDAEIVEALGVMELFSGFNKFLDSLRITIDF